MHTINIVQAYTLRWLVEVNEEPLQFYEGWGNDAKQFDEQGYRSSLILSLWREYYRNRYPEQQVEQ